MRAMENNLEALRDYLTRKGYNTFGATEEELNKMWFDDLRNYVEARKIRRKR